MYKDFTGLMGLGGIWAVHISKGLPIGFQGGFFVWGLDVLDDDLVFLFLKEYRVAILINKKIPIRLLFLLS